MSGQRIEDVTEVEVEHLLGLATEKGLVKFRAIGPRTILLAQFEPAQAREIAQHLMEAAARAEYEQDFASEMRRSGVPAQQIARMMLAVREGEQRRHEGGG